MSDFTAKRAGFTPKFTPLTGEISRISYGATAYPEQQVAGKFGILIYS